MTLSLREGVLQLKVGKVGRNVSSKPAHAMKKVKKHTLKSKDTKRPVLRAFFDFQFDFHFPHVVVFSTQKKTRWKQPASGQVLPQDFGSDGLS